MYFIGFPNNLQSLIRAEMYTVAFLYNINIQKAINLTSWLLPSVICKAYFYVIYSALF